MEGKDTKQIIKIILPGNLNMLLNVSNGSDIRKEADDFHRSIKGCVNNKSTCQIVDSMNQN